MKTWIDSNFFFMKNKFQLIFTLFQNIFNEHMINVFNFFIIVN